MNFQYNYVFFNTADSNSTRKDPMSYNTICIRDLETLDNVHVVSYPLDYAPYFVRCLFAIHRRPELNKLFELPFKKLWYPFYFKKKFKEDKPLCFVVSGTYANVGYLRYLRKKYPEAKIVKIHRDLFHLWKKRNPEFTDELMKELFDYTLTYDEIEAQTYGWPSFSEYESKIDVPRDNNYPLCDVYFAGRAKERLPKLIETYRVLTDAGLSVQYYITGVPKEERIEYPGIEYGERSMAYAEMLYKTVNCKCVLEINQEGAVGYTSRFLEAVIFNKKLLTDNLAVQESKFYDERYIQCFTNPEDIDTDFVKADEGEIDYQYNNEFSPIKLIEQIDKMLVAAEG